MPSNICYSLHQGLANVPVACFGINAVAMTVPKSLDTATRTP